MKKKLAVIMDSFSLVHYKKDSTLAMLFEAQDRGYALYFLEQKDLFLLNDIPFGRAKNLTVFRDANQFYKLGDEQIYPLADFNIILMRKDPPFNEEYIYTTYILEHAERLGSLVVNKPQSLRDANEKLFITHFPQCIPETLVTQSAHELYQFWEKHQDIVCKPLNTMGGKMVFRLKQGEVNANVIFDTLTQGGTFYIMAQGYIPAIVAGDKRIILINGKPVMHALTRIPQGNDWRGNLAVGAKATVQPLSDRDQFICDQVGPALRERGLYFVGIDVIGDYLTEINVTSPTGIRELDAARGINISAMLFDCLESH
ncbi:MAG: glutathione synthase [Gammaproteobacteria bacterium]|nr:glutathione synthase [Gammaproteobacteria bacterium]